MNSKIYRVIACLVLIIVLGSTIAACTKAAPSPTPSPTPAQTSKPSPTATTPPASPDKVYTWTFTVNAGASPIYWGFDPYPWFQEMVHKATNNRVKINTKILLVPGDQVPAAVLDGRADMGTLWIPLVSGTFPVLDFGSLPFFFYNRPLEYLNAVNDPRLDKILNSIYEEKGFAKLANINSSEIDAIFSTRAVKTVDDFKGLKIRAIGMVTTLAFQSLGAAPLVMPLGEVADALRKRTVDAISTSVGYGLGSLGMADAATDLSYWPVQSEYGGSIIVNLKKWNELPDDLKGIMLKVGKDFQQQELYSAYVHNLTAKTDVKSTKLKITQPEQAELVKAGKITKPAIDKWLEVAGPQGKDILAIISEYATGAK